MVAKIFDALEFWRHQTLKCISSDSNSIGDNSDHFSTTNLQKQEVYRLAEEEENCTIEHRNFSVDYIVNTEYNASW